MSHRKALIKLIEANGHRHSNWQVFSDFVEMAAISISNAVDWSQREKREARYLEIVKRYEADEVARFPQMMGALVLDLEAGADDVLGDVFMQMELGSKWHGQFFTPFELCRMMARMMVDDRMRELIDARGFIRAQEPACGGGAMIIALADEMRRADINYQQHLHVVAQDLDFKAVCMAYVQLSLLHIPAVVIEGNTLTMEQRSHWYTPAHIMDGWKRKLEARDEQINASPAAIRTVAPSQEDAGQSVDAPIETVISTTNRSKSEAPQLSLF